MPRPAPKAGVANASLVGGIGLEASQLAVGERFAGDADEKNRDANEVL
jgi:hypothetical protein